MAIKTVGFLSFKTGNVYKSKAARKGAETKNEKKVYSQKLEQLQSKFSK